MASTPGFANVPRTAQGALAGSTTTDKSGATTTNIVDILTGGASGTKIDEIRVAADGNPADCTIIIFLYNGSAYKYYDDFDIGDPAASSTTVAGYIESRKYDNLYLPTSSWKIACGITVATTSGNVQVWAHGADF